MSICPSCASHNRPQARFCRVCGKPLPRPDPYSRYLTLVQGRLREIMTFPGWGDVKAFDTVNIDRELRDRRYYHGSDKTTFLTDQRLAEYPVRLFAEQHAHTPGRPYANWFNRAFIICEERPRDFSAAFIQHMQGESVKHARAARDSFVAEHVKSAVVSLNLVMVSLGRIAPYQEMIEDFFDDSSINVPGEYGYEVLNVIVGLEPPVVFATTHETHPWHGPGLSKFFWPA